MFGKVKEYTVGHNIVDNIVEPECSIYIGNYPFGKLSVYLIVTVYLKWIVNPL